jgi:hypothetical protein
MGNIMKGLSEMLSGGGNIIDVLTGSQVSDMGILGNGNFDDSEEDKNLPVLKITNIKTGFSLSTVSNGVKIKVLAIETYAASISILGESTTFNVMRDGYLSRGHDDSQEHFANQCFEPDTNNTKVYFAHLNSPYPNPNDFDLKAFALTDEKNTSIRIDALPFEKEQLTYLNGDYFFSENANHTRNPKLPNVASGVMIHIGGYYQRLSSEKGRIATSYGCFGFIPHTQVYSSKEDAEKMKSNPAYNGTSNKEYAELWKKIGVHKKIKISIDRRADFDKTISINF